MRTTRASTYSGRPWRTALLVVLLLGLGGCARHYTGVNDPYGFWSGIWHGLVFPYALLANVVSWMLGVVGIDFKSSIQLVGRPNTGLFFYWIGYVLGLGTYGGSAAR